MVVLFFEGTRLLCANAGDSRAIKCAAFQGDGSLQVQPMSNDHKPDDPLEAARILQCGGRIDSFRDT